MKSYKSIALMDTSHMLRVNFHAQANDAAPNDAGQLTLNQLSVIRQDFDHVIMCVDSPPYWRLEHHPAYKAGREKNEAYPQILRWTLDRLELDGYRIAKAPTFEADDVIATLARYYGTTFPDCRVVILGADKDALQCITDNVHVYVPKGRGEYEVRDLAWMLKSEKCGYRAGKGKVTEQLGWGPHQHACAQAIMGDKGDNIEGIPSFGPVKAGWLVQTYGTDFVKMRVAYSKQVEAAQSEPEGKLSAFWKTFGEHMMKLDGYLKLTTLRTDVPVDAAELLTKREPKPLVEEQGGTWGDNEEPDEALDAIEAQLDADFPHDGPSAEELTEERAVMAAEAASVISGPPANSTSQAEFRAQLERDRELDLQIARAQRAGYKPNQCDSHADCAEHDKAALAAGTQAQHPRAGNPPSWAPKASRAQLPDPNAGAILEQARKEFEAGEAKRKESPDVPMGDPRTAVVNDLLQAAAAKSTPPPASAAEPTNGAQVVPNTQGPQRGTRKVDALEEPPVMAIQPYAHPSWALSTQPASAGHAFSIAVKLHNSQLYVKKFTRPEAIAAVILRGRELGLGMTTALDAFHVVEGRPMASSQLISALAESDENHEYTMMISADDTHATFECKHKKHPKPTVYTYNIEEAERLGLLRPSLKTGQPSQWVKRPKTMLIKTCKATLHRMMFPGSTLGLHMLETNTEDSNG